LFLAGIVWPPTVEDATSVAGIIVFLTIAFAVMQYKFNKDKIIE